MKLAVHFTLEKNEIPKKYREIFLSFFKKSLTDAENGKYFDQYYEPGQEKDFTFSVFFSNPKFLQTTIELGEARGKLLFSCSDKFTGFLFFSAFLEQMKKPFLIEGGNQLTVTSVKQVQQPEVKESQAMVKMLSPLCIRRHVRESNRDMYYLYNQKEFEERAAYVVKHKLMRAGFSQEISDTLSIIPVNCKKTVVDFYHKKLPCSLGYFLLEGDRAILNYLLQSGIGSHCSAGFGMAELK
ncbi:MAG: CRISPR-associated endoribonuclease Cas6 [Firmicutes bacterium]|nr:CRISPR-associated endoribonuclease Cas6 [Bacillota bacterium]